MTAKLTYFNGRSRAETIRLMLAASGVDFVEFDLTEREQIEKMRKDGDLLYGQVPMLEIDNIKIAQSGAATRYLARKSGMYGLNPTDDLFIDMYYEGCKDFLGSFIPLVFCPVYEVLKRAEEKASNRYLPAFEKVLSKSANDYLVGDKLTLADVALLEVLLLVDEFLPNTLDKFPLLKDYYQKVKSIPNIQTYLNGPQRPKANDENYVATIKKVLDVYPNVIP